MLLLLVLSAQTWQCHNCYFQWHLDSCKAIVSMANQNGVSVACFTFGLRLGLLLTLTLTINRWGLHLEVVYTCTKKTSGDCTRSVALVQ